MEESEGTCVGVTMSRKDTGQPWGFRMTGGKDLGCCLYIAKVNPRSLSARNGLREGDEVVRIEQTPAVNLSHDHAKAEILRAGNDLHLVVRRGSSPAGAEKPDPLADRRSVVVEEETEYKGDPNPTSQSRTFHLLNQFLHDELEELSKGPAKSTKAVNGPRPASEAECAPVRGSTYSSARKPPGGTTTEPAQGPAKPSLKASSDRPVSSPVKPKDASVVSLEASPKKAVNTSVVSSEASPKKAMNTSVASPANKAGDTKTGKTNVAPATGSVDAKANKPHAASAAVSADSKAKASPVSSEAVSAKAQHSSSALSPPAASVSAEASQPQSTSAVESVQLQESTDTAVIISADADVDVPAVVSVDADVSESVGEEAQLTIVAIDDTDGDDGEGDSADYSDADYTGGSVSEGSDEAATFTITM